MGAVEGPGRGREIVAGRAAHCVDVALGIGREVPHLVLLTPTPVGRKPHDRSIGNSRAGRAERHRVSGDPRAGDGRGQSVHPGAGPKTQEPTAAFPLASVVRVAAVTLPAPAVTAKLTMTPATPCLLWSRTVTAGGTRTAVPTIALWLVGEFAAMLAGTGAVPVALKVTGLPVTPEPATVAVSVLVPGTDPRVHSVSVAFPAESVVCDSPVRLPPQPRSRRLQRLPQAAAVAHPTRSRPADAEPPCRLPRSDWLPMQRRYWPAAIRYLSR